ncbi:EamA family transporter [Cryobacterium roopkundense]|uniref:Inner membrane transporter RhtA n=1 Tax=Cryobacterium roopkundense TaxID=1001240 RepID=A0A7W9E218_9MICO|nr:EamA family transporter [Cryobacterium roopkundense]MBB5639623.1 inner membrane transporter RhtA [Cryobacterium roopkundense]
MTGQTARQRAAVLTLLGSAASNQLGAAVGSLAFPVIGPVGVVAVRQFVAAAVLLPLVRPRVWAFTWRQWWPILLLAGVFALMNLTLYLSIERIGLGLAVTLEFLGPLGVALAGSRSRGAILGALAALLGVAAITQPQPSSDYIGVGLALVAACCWASYILLNRTVGRRVPGVVGVAAASGISATLFLPVGLVIFISNPPSPYAILCAVAAGILASAVPYVADLLVLRRLPTGVFSVLMSVNPIFAALAGAVVLGQDLGLVEWVGIGLIVGANVVALLLGRPAPVPGVRRGAGDEHGGAARPERAERWRGPRRRRGLSLRRGR